MPIICPKCNHARQETETCPATQCPACNANYVNVATIKKSKTTWMWFVAAGLVAGAVTQSELFSSREPSSGVTFGVFVEPSGMTVAGLVHNSCLPADFQTNDRFSPEEKIRVKVGELEPIRKRLALKYVRDAV